jgi:hypothetical protein
VIVEEVVEEMMVGDIGKRSGSRKISKKQVCPAYALQFY